VATGKNKIVSLAMESEYHNILKTHAEKKNVSVSSVVRDLVQRYLATDGDATKIVLSIPKSVTSDSENLSKWLNSKVAAIVQHFNNGSH
jgi:hypothetical protein